MKRDIAKRVSHFESGEIIKFIGLSKTLKNPINLSIGIPYFSTPSEIKMAAIKAIENDKTVYIEAAGLPELRSAVAEKLSTKNSIPATADNVMITAGVSGGLLLAYATIFDPGDEIIIPDPFFLAYRELAHFFEVTPKYLSTYPDFDLHIDRLREQITPKTKAILINNPNNPSGKVYSRETLQKVAELANDNNLYIIADEVYEDFVFDGNFVAMGSIYPNTITLNGISKSYASTGLRVGYLHAPDSLMPYLIEAQQFTLFSNNSVAQHAALVALQTDVSKEMEAHRGLRQIVIDGLDSHYELQGSEGGYFAFIKHPTLSGDEVYRKLLKEDVIVVPGNIFSGQDTHFRISYSVDEGTLRKGLDKINDVLV